MRLVPGTVIIIAVALFVKLLLFFTRALVARLVPPSMFGYYVFYFSATSLFAAFATLGVHAIVARDVAEGKKEHTALSYAFPLALVGTLLVSTIFPFLTIFNIPFWVILAVVIGGAAYTWALVELGVFRGAGKVREKVVFDIVRGVGVITFSILGALLLDGFGAVFGAAVGYVILAFLLSTKLPTFYGRFNPSYAREGLLFMASGIFAGILFTTDQVLLNYFWGADYLGIYGASVSLSRFFIEILFSASFLYLFSYISGQRESYKQITELLTYLGTPILVAFILFGREILSFLFGIQYVSAYPSLVLLSLALFAVAWSGPFRDVFLAQRRMGRYVAVLGIAALLNLILDLSLIPPLGIIGAATATAISLMVRNCLGIFIAGVRPSSRVFPLGFVALMLAGLFYFLPLRLLIKLPILLLLQYIVLYFLLSKDVREGIRDALWTLWAKVRGAA